MLSCHQHTGRSLTTSSLSWPHNYLPTREGRVPFSADGHKMDPQLYNTIHIEEGQKDNWVLVREPLHCEETTPQIEGCGTSFNQTPAIIIDNEALPDTAFSPADTNCCTPMIGVVLHSIKSSDANPTPDPRVEFADSTATGLTFSALEEVWSDLQPRPPAEDDSPSRPLTRANLGPNITPGLIKDIQAWLDGDQEWLHVAVNCGKASDMPFERNTTCHSSDGSLDFVFIPAQPSSFGRDAMAIGTLFENEPHIQNCGSDMELDEALMGNAI